MANEYYVTSGAPATRSKGDSAPMRAQFSNIEAGFNKLPTMAGYTNKMVKVNSAGTGLSSDTLITDNGTNVTISGEIVSTKAGQFLSRTGTSTAAHWMLISNTSGKALVGVEGSAGGAVITDALAYDAVFKGASGITFSADDGVTRHMRLRSGGQLGMGTTPSTSWGTGWAAHQWANGSCLVGHPSTEAIYLLANLINDGTNWKYVDTAPGVLLKLDGANKTMEMWNTPSGTAGTTATITRRFMLDADGNLVVVGTNGNTTANAANMYVDGSGEYYKSTSSLRYKNVLRPVSLAEARSLVLSAEPFIYSSRCDKDDPNQEHYGLGAEDLARIDDRFVFWGQDKDGNKIPDGIQYERLTVPLILLAQDFDRRLTALENKKSSKKVS